jgi:hypothetical protein
LCANSSLSEYAPFLTLLTSDLYYHSGVVPSVAHATALLLLVRHPPLALHVALAELFPKALLAERPRAPTFRPGARRRTSAPRATLPALPRIPRTHTMKASKQPNASPTVGRRPRVSSTGAAHRLTAQHLPPPVKPPLNCPRELRARVPSPAGRHGHPFSPRSHEPVNLSRSSSA